MLELPLSVHEASLTKSAKSYLLKLALGNSSDERVIGLRYSLVAIDAKNEIHPIANRTEGFSVAAYATKTLTFRSPIKLKPSGERLVMMLEQVVSHETIWEVVKAKEAFEAYARGDYSVRPIVLRVPNQVDARPDIQHPRKLYQRY